MHREDPFERKPVVQEREDRLLDLPGVVRPADQHLAAGRMQNDEGLAPCPVLLGIRGDGRRVQHERVDRHLLELVGRGIDEERLREERMPGARGDDAHADAMRRMCAGERVDDVDVAGAELRPHLLAKPLERLLGDLGVHVAPPDPLLGTGLADDELVLGRTAGVDPRVDHERATFGKARVAAGERVGVELGRRRMPVDPPAHVDAVLRERAAARDRRDHRSAFLIVRAIYGIWENRSMAAETGPSHAFARGSVTSEPFRERSATPCRPRGMTV